MATQPSIFLPRNLSIGGYIFMGSEHAFQEFFSRQIFGLPEYYYDSVRLIGLRIPIFFYNCSTGRLHGVFEATSFGSYNIDASICRDINYNDRSFFPAQAGILDEPECSKVRIQWQKPFLPLEQDSSSRILQILSVGGDRFRIELLSTEAELIMRIFEEHEY